MSNLKANIIEYLKANWEDDGIRNGKWKTYLLLHNQNNAVECF